jgi:hypothetical protein
MDVFSLVPALWNRPCLPTAAGKGGCDDEGKNMDVFSLVPALWNRPCLPTAAGKGVALEIGKNSQAHK